MMSSLKGTSMVFRAFFLRQDFNSAANARGCFTSSGMALLNKIFLDSPQ